MGPWSPSTGAVHKVVVNFTTSLFFVFDDTSFLLVRSQWDQGPKPSLLYVLYRVVGWALVLRFLVVHVHLYVLLVQFDFVSMTVCVLYTVCSYSINSVENLRQQLWLLLALWQPVGHLEWGMVDGWLSSPTRLEIFDNKIYNHQCWSLFFLSLQTGRSSLGPAQLAWGVVGGVHLQVDCQHVPCSTNLE